MIVYPKINDEDEVFLSVDPGAEHVGLALGCRYFSACEHCGGSGGEPDTAEFIVEAGAYMPTEPCAEPGCKRGYKLHNPGWRVYDTAEMTPDEFTVWFAANAPQLTKLSIEKWSLYPHLVNEQIGQEMWTSQLIGWIWWHTKLFLPDLHSTIVKYSAKEAIHGPTGKLLEIGGIDWVSPPGKNKSRGSTGDHQRAAEYHFWYRLLRDNRVDGIKLANR